MASQVSRSEPQGRAMIPEKSVRGRRWSACLCSSGVNGAAIPTPARFLATVELLEDGRKVAHNALELHLRSMHPVVAVRTVPLEGVQRTLRSRHLDHKSDCVGLALRRVANMLGQKENFTFLNGYVLWRLTRLFDDAQNDVTFQLIEELFRGIVMIVAAL